MIAPDPPLAGMLGDFRLLREVGRGGMGIVRCVSLVEVEMFVTVFSVVILISWTPKVLKTSGICGKLTHQRLTRQNAGERVEQLDMLLLRPMVEHPVHLPRFHQFILIPSLDRKGATA